MTKKSHKHFTQWRKENVGCMWGLISIFDFRRGRFAQRLLPNKKCGSSRNLGINHSRNKVGLPCNIVENDADVESITHISDNEAEEEDNINLVVSSFNRLKKKKSRARIDWIKAELGIVANAEKNQKEATKSGVVGFENNLNSPPSLISQLSDYPTLLTMLSSDLDLGEFMLDYCNNGLYWESKQFKYENKGDQYPFPASGSTRKKSEHDNVSVTVLQKAIVDLTEAFLRRNSNNLSENKEVHQPKDIANVLEMLNSNKQLFLKLLQDPNSPVRKHIHELQKVHFSKSSIPDQNQFLGELPESKRFQKQSAPYLFRKKDKLTVVSQSKEKDDVKGPNRIVVLKPAKVRNQNLSNTIASIASIQSHCDLENKEGGERLSSHFSLKEIRRRFKNVIGPSKKEKHRIAMDGIMHKIPYGKPISRKNEASCRRDHTDNVGEERSDTEEIQMKNKFSISSKTAGRKKMSKNAAPRVLYTEAAFCDEARKHLSEFLRIGNENESLSPIQVSKSLGRILSFPGFDYLSPRRNLAREKEVESLQEQTSLLLYHPAQKISAGHLNLSGHKESFSSTDKIQEAENEIMEIVEVEDKEGIQLEEARQLEAQSVLIINEDDLPSGTCKEEESSMLLKPEQLEAIAELSTPSNPIPLSSAETQEPKDTDCVVEDAGRPSPISVLESLSFADTEIPTGMITENATNVEIQTKLREPQIDNFAAASGSTDFEADLITYTEFDEALLFDELEISYGSLIDDPKLLFDSIDQVLTELKERHFSCTPWVSFIKPTIWSMPKQEYFIKESCRRMNWNLDLQFPSTLKQAVKKDLDGTIWFDLQFEAESAVDEIGDAILDYLFEETALELWD